MPLSLASPCFLSVGTSFKFYPGNPRGCQPTTVDHHFSWVIDGQCSGDCWQDALVFRQREGKLTLQRRLSQTTWALAGMTEWPVGVALVFPRLRQRTGRRPCALPAHIFQVLSLSCLSSYALSFFTLLDGTTLISPFGWGPLAFHLCFFSSISCE